MSLKMIIFQKLMKQKRKRIKKKINQMKNPKTQTFRSSQTSYIKSLLNQRRINIQLSLIIIF